MKLTISLISLLCVAVSAKLTADPIINNEVYKLENQQDGAFLSAGNDGQVKGGEYSGNPGQKWVFSEQGGPNIYTITAQGNEKNVLSGQEFEVILVGHGKRLLKNTKTDLCIHNGGRGRPVFEKECGRENPSNRWNVQKTSA